MKIDIEPDTMDDTTVKITKPEFDSSDEYRFTVNSNTLNDLMFVRESVKSDECCVAVSLYNNKKGSTLELYMDIPITGTLK